jgi:hypothetical protein
VFFGGVVTSQSPLRENVVVDPFGGVADLDGGLGRRNHQIFHPVSIEVAWAEVDIHSISAATIGRARLCVMSELLISSPMLLMALEDLQATLQ